MAFPTPLVAASAFCLFVFIRRFVISYIQSPLKKLPGPFLARFTNVWRLWNHFIKSHIETQQRLHSKHGPVVRLGPNTVSVTDPDLIKTIYSARGTFLKSEFYSINDARQPDGSIVSNIFGTRDHAFHARKIRPVRHIYKPAFAAELEPIMNDTIRLLCYQLEHRFMLGTNAGKTCDIGKWISYFTWDFLGDMTFSRRMGFMEQARDVDDMIATGQRVMRYFSVVGQLPALDYLLAKNSYVGKYFPGFGAAAGFSAARFQERIQNMEEYKDKDFMNAFLQAKHENPKEVTDSDIIGYLIINILAGADTTGIILKALLYHVLRTPQAHTRLTAELTSQSPPLPFPAPTTRLSPLPYLSACIQETLRIHPVIGHIVERVVPASGFAVSIPTTTTATPNPYAAEAQTETVVLPPGTIVGLNPWLVHYNTDVYGADADVFRPERWLRGADEDAEAFERRARRMRDMDMSFGNGNRACLGKALAMVEVGKVVAGLFGRYEMELEDPRSEWTLDKQWFVWPSGIRVRMRLREGVDSL